MNKQRERSPDDTSDPYYNLGSYHRRVSTANHQAQLWFDRGLIWTYGFNHEEAVRCFEKSIAIDPKCAMSYWGLAYALGPNYNKPWEVFDQQELESTVQRTRRAAEDAKANAKTASPVEAALIDALQYRYPHDRPAGTAHHAMEVVYKQHPDDLDVAVLYADGLMNLTPWALWDIKTGQPAPDARTLDIKTVLDRALAQRGGLSHPGLLHLIPGERLDGRRPPAGLVPDAGHLNHMPTHLDILCGDYRRAVASNSEAIRADEKFLARAGPVNFYTLYRSHDYHFRIYAAMFAGQSRGFLAVKVHVLIRFGRWEDILALELPQDQTLYCVTTSMTHYAKGVAYAALGQVDEADKERAIFQKSLDLVPPSRALFNNTCRDILAIADAMLDGEIEYRRGNIDAAFKHLQRSIALDDGLPYDEPWGWMQPTRHAYGALLLEQGQVEKAAEVYGADLGMDDTLPRALQHPNNVWSLHGYHECLTRLGRSAEARIIQQQLKLAAATADVPIRSSCFCRLECCT
ncbi:TPR domain protein [Aspergillus novofumigatus IBT 16806]|uniref:Uncharacterized protein n=1 Tax=Aspergillus novofumigatus (strain IBT 16806) TaxID=1392255 RepID=A0A2I1CP25_ASPN1|nr:uncharacterized protein P174DRAFT_437817 [Aspergillus novofumigatus IBT 16806]PKX99375.1 hypothetical protein P174DRAFT_437817 [Aspergillus novofumigatus IBT 16806]